MWHGKASLPDQSVGLRFEKTFNILWTGRLESKIEIWQLRDLIK